MLSVARIEPSASLGQEKPRHKFGRDDLMVIGGAFGLFGIVWGAMYIFARRPKEEF